MQHALFLDFYKRLLTLYPAEFQTRYAEQAFLAARDWYEASDKERHLPRFYFQLGRDLVFSVLCENGKHLGRQLMRRPILFHTLGLLVVATAVGFVGAIICQQMLRRGADEPQKQMVEAYAARLASGEDVAQAIPDYHVDVANSLEPFLTFYDDGGNPVRSTGYLESVPPIPSSGIFAYLRLHGSETVTWQPRPGVRVAAVARRVEGAHSGFLLAGRSLRVVEEYESTLRLFVLSGWLVMVVVLISGAMLLNRAALHPSLR